jgi:dihydroorotate dehydrogenase
VNVQARYEQLIGEDLKSASELALKFLGGSALGRAALEQYAFMGQGRIEDEALHTSVGRVELENPVIVGAGWDKRGRAGAGLYAVGFGAVEVGTVLPFQQAGNPKPRLWMIDRDHSVGLNRFGFNSPGKEAVANNLEASWPLPCPVGVNVGRNKEMPNEMAVWAHGEVIKRLDKYASYFVLGISSPNSPGLRGLQNKEPLREVIQGAQAAMISNKDLFAKIDGERTEQELYDVAEVAIEAGLTGIIATNTYSGSDLKARYGRRWAGEAGGLSGADPEFRRRADNTLEFLYEEAGDKLELIGVGGVNSFEAALRKLQLGASAVQVVTAMRPSYGTIAAEINLGFVNHLEFNGIPNVKALIGTATKRGAKY